MPAFDASFLASALLREMLLARSWSHSQSFRPPERAGPIPWWRLARGPRVRQERAYGMPVMVSAGANLDHYEVRWSPGTE